MVQHNSIDHSGLLSVSYASNSNSDSIVSAAGASTLVSRGDHVHASPAYELDYVEITSPVSITATTEGTSQVCITGTNKLYAAEPIIIEVFSPALEVQATAGASIIVLLYDGGTVLGRIMTRLITTSATNREPSFGVRRLTPTAATHQYIIRAFTSSGTSSFAAGAGGSGTNLPAFLRIIRA